MALFWIQTGMSVSLVCFLLGYYFRVRNNSIHRWINLLGVFSNLAAAIYLLLLKYMMGGLSDAGFMAVVPVWVVHIHRAFASIAFVMMLMMAISGIMRRRQFHVMLHRVFLPLYTVVYLSGLYIFQTG